MKMLCRIFISAFAILYIVAVFVFLTGTYGWFGQPKDPLSAIFLLPLGLPWVWGLDNAPETAKPWLGMLAPLLNLGILVMLCRRANRRK